MPRKPTGIVGGWRRWWGWEGEGGTLERVMTKAAIWSQYLRCYNLIHIYLCIFFYFPIHQLVYRVIYLYTQLNTQNDVWQHVWEEGLAGYDVYYVRREIYLFIYIGIHIKLYTGLIAHAVAPSHYFTLNSRLDDDYDINRYNYVSHALELYELFELKIQLFLVYRQIIFLTKQKILDVKRASQIVWIFNKFSVNSMAENYKPVTVILNISCSFNVQSISLQNLFNKIGTFWTVKLFLCCISFAYICFNFLRI